ITGANGFTGRHLVREMTQNGYEVIGTTHSANSTDQYIYLDIYDLSQCQKLIDTIRPDFIIHLAGLSFVQHENPEEFYRINTLGTLNILQACDNIDLKLKKIIIVSSANIYGNANTTEPIDERFAPNPVNHYACSKLAM